MTEDEIGSIVVDSVIKVHKSLGPGLLESAYEACLAYEIQKTGLNVQRQAGLPLKYEDVVLDVGCLPGQFVGLDLEALYHGREYAADNYGDGYPATKPIKDPANPSLDYGNHDKSYKNDNH